MLIAFSEESSRRQQLLEKLIRTVKKKDANDDTEVPLCYNTFGLPLEECPAAYLNKVHIVVNLQYLTLLSLHTMMRATL